MKIPIALDAIDNSLDARCSASLERLYLLDKDGVVRHRSAPGRFRMSEVDAWCEAIKALT